MANLRLVLMALGEVMVRTVVLVVRGRRVQQLEDKRELVAA